jgi:hypothetical protein
MGSRLKGKRPRKEAKRERWALYKVLLYGAVGLGVIILMWWLWLSDKGWQVTKELERNAPGGQAAGQ